MRQGPQGPPPLWLIVLVVVGLVFAAVTIGAPGVRGASWDITAITGGGYALLGVALGLFGDRLLRNRGTVRCQVQVEGLGTAHHRRGTTGPAPFKSDQSVQMHFFNEKEVDTGLSQLAVVFVYEDGKVVLGPEARDYATSTSPRGMINLPSRTWVSVDIRGSFFGPEARLLEGGTLKAIEIDGRFPGGKQYHKSCLELP